MPIGIKLLRSYTYIQSISTIKYSSSLIFARSTARKADKCLMTNITLEDSLSISTLISIYLTISILVDLFEKKLSEEKKRKEKWWIKNCKYLLNKRLTKMIINKR